MTTVPYLSYNVPEKVADSFRAHSKSTGISATKLTSWAMFLIQRLDMDELEAVRREFDSWMQSDEQNVPPPSRPPRENGALGNMEDDR